MYLKRDTIHTYLNLYRGMNFERAGLFGLIAKEFRPQVVLYPGCSIHITPSFYFGHVVYVDKSELSNKFFSDSDAVNALIDQNKSYKPTAYWKFVQADFRNDLKFRAHSFDFLISLFSGKQIYFTQKYLKKGGLILTSSFFSDEDFLTHNTDYSLLSCIVCKADKYSFCSAPPERKRSGLKGRGKQARYRDHETYFIYEKLDERQS